MAECVFSSIVNKTKSICNKSVPTVIQVKYDLTVYLGKKGMDADDLLHMEHCYSYLSSPQIFSDLNNMGCSPSN